MAGSLHRTQLLLEPYQHRTLKKLARTQNRSVSALVRQIISLYLDEVEQQSLWSQRARIVGQLSDTRARIAAGSLAPNDDLLAETRHQAEKTAERVWEDEG